MRIPKSMTVASAEALIATLVVGEATPSLEIPTRGKHHVAGGEAAYVQAFASWGNSTGTATLKTYAPSADDVQVQRLTDRLYGLAATLCARQIFALDNTDITSAVRRTALKRLDQLQAKNPQAASRGPQVEIVCADHLARSHPQVFYDIDNEGVASVRRLPAFSDFVKGVLLPATVTPELQGGVKDGMVRALGSALHELFRNTDEHGRSDERGDARRVSIRGLHARRHAIAPADLQALTAASPPLAAYCRGLRPARNDNEHIQLIELSIFDSGPGLAASISGRPVEEIGIEEEFEAAASCFLKNVSRKPSSSSGLGLPNMVDVLSRQKGFLRVRTGRLALYSDLSTDPVEHFGEAPVLNWWREDQRRSAPVAGTLFTLLFPLEV